jgi:fatty acid desaturase
MTVMPTARDYSLIGRDGRLAVETGLAAAEWYHTDIPRKEMKELMKREDGPAIRDTILWLSLFLLFAGLTIALWPSWWAVLPLFAYGTLYGSTGDSRWHECGHGTAFKTRWMNDAVYQFACFIMIREPEIWRWSHTRHHTDTIIVGRDPEIVAMRPPRVFNIFVNFLGITNVPKQMWGVIRHAFGSLSAEERTFVPEMEWPKVVRTARIWLAIHLVPVALALWLGSWLPVLLVGPLPTMYGAWFSVLVGLTQHAGLAENVLDHRLNSRTIYMNPVFRFMYWNMNYHVEHHMFPMVPYHRLPDLHARIKDDCPEPYPSTWAAWKEIVPALARQLKDPEWFVERRLPSNARAYRPEFHGEILHAAPAE